MRNLLAPVLLGSAVALLSGCEATGLSGLGASDEPTGLSADEYQYKGAVDPLLSTDSAARSGTLSDRFDLVQGRQ